ncbi:MULTISPECIES: hypothetical protein [unclassified Streptomyces]|uniref:hypothetical protein n=1 Tax=unclassified Streptomyces TaxID=2593676 RepID=UPI00225C0147|nr:MULTISPECIES: hypothetical protein [unclassified Streptomyces]MCX4527387.1 hypothetical protein [Streptomyces sp. NBC_01551]MCX4542032.1 hypothetical protein [Streptomyces sp. NBC_01565]
MEVVAVRRGAVRSVVVAGSLVLGVAGLAGGAQASARDVTGAWAGPEADVSYHGRVKLTQGRLRVWLVPENDGPSALPNATVRVRLSADLADRQALSEGCARIGTREVVCETGALPEHGRGRHITLALELRERPPEVSVRFDTWWNGGASDRNRSNNELAVLALDTGDSYAF